MESGGESADRVLVVDGDADVREATCDLLRASGFAVDGAASGALALERFLVFRPEAVVFDFWTPVMDGRELVHALRELSRSRLALVAMSDTPEVEDWCQRVAIGGFVPKPIVGERLLHALRMSLDGARATSIRTQIAEPMTSRRLRIASAVLVVGDGEYVRSAQAALRSGPSPVQVACVSSVADAMHALRAVAVDAIAVIGRRHTDDPRFPDMAAECAARGVHVVVEEIHVSLVGGDPRVSDDPPLSGLVTRVRDAIGAARRAGGAA